MKYGKQQSGFTLILVLIVVMIAAAIFFGSSFFSEKDSEISNIENNIQILDKAKVDIEQINNNLKDK